MPTVLPSGTVWDIKQSRLLVGVEQLALQGVQFENLDALTNNQWQDVAGNAFPDHCMFDGTSMFNTFCFVIVDHIISYHLTSLT